MNRISQFLASFFRKVEATDCAVKQEELYNGQAFTYKTHKLAHDIAALSTNTITATLHKADGTEESFSETINQSGIINAVSIFRTKEAFGMTNVVGAAFGKLKEPR